MTKSIFIAITGRANVGKSSLMNLLTGEKIAIVSDKPQTTRTRINGILTKDETQYVFIDTPGMHKAKNRLSVHMIKSIRSSVIDVDVIIYMVDATKRISDMDREMIKNFSQNEDIPVIILLNKVDLIKDKSLLLEKINEYNSLYNFREIIPISVKKKENTENLLKLLDNFAKEGEHFFPDDIITDQPEKIWLAEIVREKLLRSMFEEIPHGIAVEIESFEESTTTKGKPIIDLGVLIICEKASHKGMIIGKQGSNLKRIGSKAREEMEDYFDSKINMKIWVKVKEDWRNRESDISDFGLSFDD